MMLPKLQSHILLGQDSSQGKLRRLLGKLHICLTSTGNPPRDHVGLLSYRGSKDLRELMLCMHAADSQPGWARTLHRGSRGGCWASCIRA